MSSEVSAEQFDVVFIGAGPGGYTGAIKAAQLGLKTAIIEKRKTLGGTCLNVGCIPSKALLQSSERYSQAQHEFKDHGIDLSSVKLNLEKMMERKSKVVTDLTKGVEFLMNKHKITVFFGEGSFKNSKELTVKMNDGGTKSVVSKSFVISTGSAPNHLGFDIDEEQIVTSTGALELKKVPKKMIIIGGGVIGLELGSVWTRLGAQVKVVEFGDKIAASCDGAIIKAFERSLKKQGMEFLTGHKVNSAEKTDKGQLEVEIENVKSGEKMKESCDVLLVAAGRVPFTASLGLENTKVELNERGFVKVNGQFKTTDDNIYAIGDVIPGPMLAHKAEEEGVCLAEILAGHKAHVNYKTVPSVIYTWPEVALVGLTEEEAKAQFGKVKVGKFPFTANGRAKANGFTDGMVKIIAKADNDELLGAHIIGPDASNLLAEVTMAMEFGGSAEDVARAFHAHPTLTEAVREAALDVDKSARQM
jgi:dihydrolipoamide dehydrogenase